VRDRGPADFWHQREISFADAAGALRLRVGATRTATAMHRVTFEVYHGDRPVLTALADGGCAIHHARAIRYDGDGTAVDLVHFAPDLVTVEASEPLNPPVPPGPDPGGVTVAQVDSGVTYTLPLIAERLARDADGAMLGYDFWDMDPRPFDGDFGRSPFFPIRHGTPVASLLLREVPDARLVPYRYPRPDMARMADVVAAAAAAGAAVVAMPMGSTRRADWTAFEAAAEAHPELLFVVSAGDDGRDIDADPLYPASLPLANMIVVASADDFGRLAPGANWGAVSVDLMVPGERVEVIDFRGARGTASGSSFAVPRVAALAARLKAAHPDWDTAALKRGVFARAVPPLQRGAPRVAVGWIPNPADDG
jgi:subtilisin family serine protease